ncbi:MAG TPA: ABC transporter permease, partial [Anaerolineales bacterium]
MSLPLTYLRIALNNIRRSGQRTVVALLCVAFGVMSLAAMSILAERISAVLLVDASHSLGGDLEIDPAQVEFFPESGLDEIRALQENGMVSAYTPLAQNNHLAFRTLDSGELHFVSQGVGMDPSVYPLVGQLDLAGGGSPAAALLARGDVLVTRDLAQENGLIVGQELLLSDLSVGVP